MNKRVLVVAGGCAAFLVVCAVCIGVMAVLNVPARINQALSNLPSITPGAQGAATLAPNEGTATQPTGVPSAGRTKGNPNAPIAFVDYSDFQ